MKRGSQRPGIVFVLSAPSGTGKTTLSHRLLRRIPGLCFSVSHTTRAPRPGERQGSDYHFVSEREFMELRKRGEFLEWARVDGASYGTSREQMDRHLGDGKDVLLDIDTQGAAQVRGKINDAVLIFLLPPGPAELRRRHRRRGTSAAVMARRLRLARREVTRCREYDYLVVNDQLEEAIRNIGAIIRSERCRTLRQRHRAASILRAFRTARPASP